jgi:hypothetical protein
MTGPSEFDEQYQKREFFHQEGQPPRASITQSNDASSIESLIKDVVKQSVKDGAQMRKLGVMFRDLRVVGLGVGAAIQHNLVSLFYP